MQSRAKVTTQCLYRNLCTAYRLVTNLETRVNFRHTFLGSNIFPQRIFRTVLLSERDEILQRWGSGQSKRIPRISRTLVRWCGDMHQSFTGALVNCFFPTIFPMFANISALSIHRIALGLCASFLYASTLPA